MTKWELKSEFDEFQEAAMSTAIYPSNKALEYTALGLASEAGEFAGKVKKWIRDGHIDDKLAAHELGDCLWYIAAAADALGYDLSEIADLVLNKLKDRKERNVISGSGDER